MNVINRTETADSKQHFTFLGILFYATHLATALAFVTDVSLKWVAVAVASYYVRMFAITAGYHRYFSHRAFKTSRLVQFLLAFLAQTSAQKGVLWWAANHRHHHRYSDEPEDIHSPVQRGFWWSHVGWVLSARYEATNLRAIADFARFPELVWLNRHSMVPPLFGLVIAYLIGGFQAVVWAGIIPTVFLWHGTFTINSLTHVFGKRRYLTTDTSRNHWLLALITCGEGWHNNHHYHQNTANQGWFWWEVDLTYYVLKVMSWFGLVWDLRLPNESTRYAHLKYSDEQKARLHAESRFGMRRLPSIANEAPASKSLSPGLMAPAPAAAIRRR